MHRNFRRILLEAAILLFCGLGFALLANQLSPRGLSLKRDYFGQAKTAALPVATPTNPPSLTGTNQSSPSNGGVATPNAAGVDPELQARLAQKGLSLIDVQGAEKLFRDPQYEQELIVFVDARNDHHYQEGHIPGAYQFDRYYPEKYLPNVLPPCLNAALVVVYCTGGKCEDSEFAAETLVEAGVPAPKVFVFAGGITDWAAHKLPIETGSRRSGNLLNAKAVNH